MTVMFSSAKVGLIDALMQELPLVSHALIILSKDSYIIILLFSSLLVLVMLKDSKTFISLNLYSKAILKFILFSCIN